MIRSMTTTTKSKIDSRRPRRPSGRARSLPNNVQTQKILVTLAERPYPFPSRTRKSSSPAPKILRGQPFGKIGRRQDFCVSGDDRRCRRVTAVRDGRSRRALSGMAAADPRDARPPIAPEPSAPASPYVRPRSARSFVGDGRAGGSPARRADHRCTALTPRRAPAADKQRRLCLAAEHVECSTYAAAEAARRSRRRRSERIATACRAPAIAPHDARPPRAAASPRPAARLPARSAAPARWRSSLCMVVAFAIVALTPVRRGASARPVASPADVRRRRRRAVDAGPDATPDRDRRSAAADPSSADPSAGPGVVPDRPTRSRRGDTLIGVAAKFRTTATAHPEAQRPEDLDAARPARS